MIKELNSSIICDLALTLYFHKIFLLRGTCPSWYFAWFFPLDIIGTCFLEGLMVSGMPVVCFGDVTLYIFSCGEKDFVQPYFGYKHFSIYMYPSGCISVVFPIDRAHYFLKFLSVKFSWLHNLSHILQ